LGELGDMTSDQLVEWIKETERRTAALPEAVARLHALTGMSFGDIAEAVGGHKGTYWKRVKRYERESAE